MNAPMIINKYRNKINSKNLNTDNLEEFLKINDAMIISNKYLTKCFINLVK
jgi:hypothetical protein